MGRSINNAQWPVAVLSLGYICGPVTVDTSHGGHVEAVDKLGHGRIV